MPTATSLPEPPPKRDPIRPPATAPPTVPTPSLVPIEPVWQPASAVDSASTATAAIRVGRMWARIGGSLFRGLFPDHSASAAVCADVLGGTPATRAQRR